MLAALAFGRRNLGRTAPNPSVGALVINDGIVIGRGVTAPGGRPHAEAQALLHAGPAGRGATMVVSLEPCSHQGRAGPCADAIIAAGITRVVMAILDPDPRVAGRGLDRLRAAGVAVTLGPCAAEARRDHLGHIRRVTLARPMVTLKLAQTVDGIAAALPGERRLMITGALAAAWVHRARAMHDAVMIGGATAIADDPQLTVRLPGMTARQPLRVVLAARSGLLPSSRLARTAARHPVLLLTTGDRSRQASDGMRALGIEVVPVQADADGRPDVAACLHVLAARGLTRIFCEGGPTLGAALLGRDCVDEVVLLTGSRPFGRDGHPALDAPSRSILDDPERFRLAEDRAIGTDRLRRYERRLPCSPD